ncbi:succinate dehydrogenase cytochrome b subunit [Weeksellaceae bacterium KMM 9724]|uniref:succinate dehydrogenase cytochrome b subunit n=1 Tax=Profundicola chukchiensis TaxID=2961959 RepID=UPI00243F4579|nr:succinate dehydrogenase cytochrome b subunit [Profundicola chukchiensis]MDG4950130.1 succinate dehydrogenase cytochrome b subunit [Profundicola chukchiensis]
MAKGLFNSSIGRKFAMALSAFFLLIFLLQHFLINMLSVFSEDLFNSVSHFMGTNPFIQFAMQPILIAGIVLHFVLGFILELQNKKARPVAYAKSNPSHNSTWMSRNMIWSGLVILAFLGLHFYDFWLPEITHKYVNALPADETRYFGELAEKFHSPVRVGLYVVAFVLLMMHLLHGFQSAFQSMGANHRKYNGLIKGFGKVYAIVIPLGFIFIAVYHFLNQ